jgi:hypothetical protein
MTVNFEEDNKWLVKERGSNKETFFLTNFLVRKKIIKDENTANILIGAIAICIIMVSTFVMVKNYATTEEDTRTYSNLSEIEKAKIPYELRQEFENVSQNKDGESYKR